MRATTSPTVGQMTLRTASPGASEFPASTSLDQRRPASTSVKRWCRREHLDAPPPHHEGS